MPRSQSLATAAAYFDDGRFFTDLERRIAMPTESDAGAAPPELGRYLADEMQASLEPLGFECRIVANPVKADAGPFLIARRVEDASLPTVLTYAHGDVVSGQAAQWREGLAPWRLVIDGERWYGRGTADNKGQHTVNFGGLAAAIAARGGRLGYNVTVLMEMGEEAASPGLREICKLYGDELAADLFIASDGPRVSERRPTLFLGSRGAVNFTLRLKSRDRAFHSGNWGGVLTNPAVVISHAVASMVDRHGRLMVDGLRPPAVSEATRLALAEVQVGDGPNDPALDLDWGEPGLSPAEQLFGWNTIEVLALGAGSAQRPVNAIPGEALAHCQLRFVVGTPWQRLREIVLAHLAERGFGEVEVNVTLEGAATRLDVEHPWVRWAAKSIEQSCGQAPTILPNLAGSLPNDVFADVLGLPTLWVPHSYAACGQHAPNEHLLAPVAREGLQLMAGLYWDLGEANGSPWSAASR